MPAITDAEAPAADEPPLTEPVVPPDGEPLGVLLDGVPVVPDVLSPAVLGGEVLLPMLPDTPVPAEPGVLALAPPEALPPSVLPLVPPDADPPIDPVVPDVPVELVPGDAAGAETFACASLLQASKSAWVGCC